MPLTLLQVISKCDNCRPHRPSPVPSAFDEEKLIPWTIGPNVIGLLRPVIVDALLEDSGNWEISTEKVSFAAHLDTQEKRTSVMKELCIRWRDEGKFPNVCGPSKWRNELYPVYLDPFALREIGFEMERSACALFGVVTYGVHMNAFSSDGRMWIPTRSMTKQTFPGLLDNTVAGGIPSGMGVFDALVKECEEEASIPESIARNAKAAGCISYFYRTEQGWMQPEIEYVFDLDLGERVPTPSDGEVAGFELMEIDKVLEKVKEGKFKPNCALVVVDWMVRTGRVTQDNEEDFMSIICRMHGDFDYHSW